MIKIKTTEQNVHFIGCCHFGHDKDFVWKTRGHNSVQEHDASLIEKWNLQVHPRDIVFSLGDFIFGFNAEERLKGLLEKLNFGALYMLEGNHLSGQKQLKEQYGKMPYLTSDSRIVNFLTPYEEIMVDGQFVVLSHYPIASFNRQSNGAFHLHSHCHQNLVGTPLGDILYSRKVLDVGADLKGRPLDFSEIKSILDARASECSDHHNSKTQSPF